MYQNSYAPFSTSAMSAAANLDAFRSYHDLLRAKDAFPPYGMMGHPSLAPPHANLHAPSPSSSSSHDKSSRQTHQASNSNGVNHNNNNLNDKPLRCSAIVKTEPSARIASPASLSMNSPMSGHGHLSSRPRSSSVLTLGHKSTSSVASPSSFSESVGQQHHQSHHKKPGHHMLEPNNNHPPSHNKSQHTLPATANGQLHQENGMKSHNQHQNNNNQAYSHVKKPLNAFMLFMKEKRAEVVAQSTMKESSAINQVLGKKVSYPHHKYP